MFSGRFSDSRFILPCAFPSKTDSDIMQVRPRSQQRACPGFAPGSLFIRYHADT